MIYAPHRIPSDPRGGFRPWGMGARCMKNRSELPASAGALGTPPEAPFGSSAVSALILLDVLMRIDTEGVKTTARQGRKQERCKRSDEAWAKRSGAQAEDVAQQATPERSGGRLFGSGTIQTEKNFF